MGCQGKQEAGTQAIAEVISSAGTHVPGLSTTHTLVYTSTPPYQLQPRPSSSSLHTFSTSISTLTTTTHHVHRTTIQRKILPPTQHRFLHPRSLPIKRRRILHPDRIRQPRPCRSRRCNHRSYREIPRQKVGPPDLAHGGVRLLPLIPRSK